MPDARTLFAADLQGDSWRIAAPPGSRVVRSDRWPHRLRAEVPGLLSPLSIWELIEAARHGLYGLRVLASSPHGTSSYITCLWGDDPSAAPIPAIDRREPTP